MRRANTKHNRLWFTCVSLQATGYSADHLSDLKIGVLTVVDDDAPKKEPYTVHLEPIATAIVLEEQVVMDNVRDLPRAVCLLVGLTYALNLKYPKCMWKTLEFIQKVWLGLGGKTLPPKMQSLKISLME